MTSYVLTHEFHCEGCEKPTEHRLLGHNAATRPIYGCTRDDCEHRHVARLGAELPADDETHGTARRAATDGGRR